MEAVTTMLSNAVTVFGSCWDAMTSNVPIAILVGLSLLGSGAGPVSYTHLCRYI